MDGFSVISKVVYHLFLLCEVCFDSYVCSFLSLGYL